MFMTNTFMLILCNEFAQLKVYLFLYFLKVKTEFLGLIISQLINLINPFLHFSIEVQA